MLVIGIDPGTAITGFGILEEQPGGGIRAIDYGVIRTKTEQSQPERLLALQQDLLRLVLKYQPAEAAVEKLFFQKNVKTALAVGEARGVVLLTLAMHHIPLAEYTPSDVKQTVVGYGAAEKKQVQFMVTELLKLESIPQPDDAADALAIALCHLHHYKYRDLAGLR